ncbi:MAG: methyltransferase [Candidatus Paceibacterota bacterium]|jgi:protein-S-isoprenylcysteine O-methyltransferase Ste14
MSKKYLKELFTLFLSISGYVPSHATILRTIAMTLALALSFYFIYFQTHNSGLAIAYFVLSEFLYIGFVYCVLSKNGLRHWFIKKWGNEERGYLAFEAILGFLFFNNGASIAYISSSTTGILFDFVPKKLILILVIGMFGLGFIVKILAAKAISIDIYYWKDMFLGRKICDFVITGPYKYFKNPMYGVGQLQSYAIAIWYGSILGLFVAVVNQCLVFSFFFLKEREFIKRIYKS